MVDIKYLTWQGPPPQLAPDKTEVTLNISVAFYLPPIVRYSIITMYLIKVSQSIITKAINYVLYIYI